MPLVFLPAVESLFLWGEPSRAQLAPLEALGEPAAAELITPEGLQEVSGRRLPVLSAATLLATFPTSELTALPASLASWVLASKLSMDLVARERVVPTITRQNGQIQARWAAALSAAEDAQRVQALARSLPAAAHAVPIRSAVASDSALRVWAADALLRAFLDAVVDALLRSARGAPSLPTVSKSKTRGTSDSWDARFHAALEGEARNFDVRGFGERSVLEDVERWSEPALGARDRLRACFRLELPSEDRADFLLRFLLQSPDDPSLLVSAAEVWQANGNLSLLGRAFREPQESLLQSLGRAARLFAPIATALEQARPEALSLDPAAAWSFLGEGALTLSEAGFGVIVPGELTRSGQRRLRLRLRVGSKSKVAGTVSGAAGLGLDELVGVDWQVVIGDQALTAQELAELAKQKAPLVQYRGAWVAIDPRELSEIQARIEKGTTALSTREAVQLALAGETRAGTLQVAVSAGGSLAALLTRLKGGADTEVPPPRELRATLRPYQQRGLSWLTTLSELGFGACLADDMGLGKTMQLLSFLLRRLELDTTPARPVLLVAPTSVIGNWEREAERFAPSLRLVRHYGADRARSAAELPSVANALVLTTYGLLRRDAQLFANVDFGVAVLDEAQNIKNSASSTARAAFSLRSPLRIALTGTPVENRLAELWSISEFANPGLLGSLPAFRQEFAVPIERYSNEDAATRLRKIVGPFVLRRLKSDPKVISDLPAKHEMKVVCTLTREQASLYKAVVDEEMRRIAETQGIERKGRVLALLTFTKQICNHPAQYLSEQGPLAQRSGKLSRVAEMLEEALAAGDKALVFTQFRDMGDKLVEYLSSQLETEILFLHGGTSKTARDTLVRRFQEEPHAARVFVLSVKAGGTGLNLTAANHVFHYDRWWNPAVEDQATDRAYRIGQRRAVQVHKLVCAGTVEEKIDALIDAKRKLAQRVVGSGEQWLTELGTEDLRELFALSASAVAVSDEGDEAR